MDPIKTQIQTSKADMKPEPQKSSREIELEKQILELQAKAKSDKIKAEKDAVEKVCAAVGVDPSELEGMKPKAPERIVELDIGSQCVTINGLDYRGRFKVPAVIAETILMIAGAARERKLKEKVGRDMEIIQLATGAISSRQIGQAEESLPI
jgi:hypothetical protein